jgi:hypothetical protein
MLNNPAIIAINKKKIKNIIKHFDLKPHIQRCQTTIITNKSPIKTANQNNKNTQKSFMD